MCVCSKDTALYFVGKRFNREKSESEEIVREIYGTNMQVMARDLPEKGGDSNLLWAFKLAESFMRGKDWHELRVNFVEICCSFCY